MESMLGGLPYWHVEALEWFEANAGRTFARRPFDVGLSIKVTSAQKGIWKPAATPYALSVVQTSRGVYPDQEPEFYSDGSWIYSYHQQGSSPDDLREPNRHFANVALFVNQAAGVPVGVVIPAEANHGYKVLGLGRIDRYDRGMFTFSGPVSLSLQSGAAASRASEVTVALIDFSPSSFDPAATEDEREKTIAEVVRRQGQPRFRRVLLDAYEGRCAMSGYDAEPALEAAHIVPYRGRQTNHPANGLLLRADLHDLFDLGLVAVDPSDMRLHIANVLAGTMYEPMHGEPLRLPRESTLQPSSEALEKHYGRSAVA